MFKKHFQVVLTAVGLMGMTWLCGCRTAGHRGNCETNCETASTSPAQQAVASSGAIGREVAPTPPAEKTAPYDEPTAKAMPRDEQPFNPFPDDDGTNAGRPATPAPKQNVAEDDQPLMPIPEKDVAQDEQPATTPPDRSVATDDRPSDGTAATDAHTNSMELPKDRLAALRELGALVELNRDGDVVAIDFSAVKAADSDMRYLQDLAKLEQLNLRGTQVTDAGLAHLRSLKALKLLDLGKTKVTDGGLANLKDLTGLEYLLLGHTKITDAGLKHLEQLGNLKGLSLIKTEITPQGIQKVKQSLRNCQVVADNRPEQPAAPAANDAEPGETEQKDTAAAEDNELSGRSMALPFNSVVQTSRDDGTAVSTQRAAVVPVSKVELNLNDPAVLGSVGQFYASQGRWREAIDVLNSALSASPEQDALRYRLGVALAKTGNVDEAVPHLVKTVGQARAHYNLGVILYENALQASEHHFQQAIRLQTDFGDAKFWLAEIRSARNRLPSFNDPFRTAQSSYDLLPLPMICPASRPMDTRQARLN